jgi:hypothetical protein
LIRCGEWDDFKKVLAELEAKARRKASQKTDRPSGDFKTTTNTLAAADEAPECARR